MSHESRLRSELERQGGLLAASLTSRPPGTLQPGGAVPTNGRGPRTRGHEDEYELLLAIIREGSELHYGAPRVLEPADEDLALLLGDQLYALGLQRLAALGDLAAVAELADAISLAAQAGANGDDALREAAWDAGSRAIGWGSSAAHEGAKQLARAGDPTAVAALRTASS